MSKAVTQVEPPAYFSLASQVLVASLCTEIESAARLLLRDLPIQYEVLGPYEPCEILRVLLLALLRIQCQEVSMICQLMPMTGA